jgi:hypothetical protein
MDLPLWVVDERESLLREAAAEYRNLSPEDRGHLLAVACRAGDLKWAGHLSQDPRRKPDQTITGC